MASLNFVPSGSLSDFYSGNMAAPDRGPNGTLVQSQMYGQPTSLSQIYGGIIPSQAPMRVSPVGAGAGSYGNLQGLVGDPIYGGQSSGSGAIRTAGQAGNVAMPPGVTPQSVQQAFARMAQQPNAAQRSALAQVVPVGNKDQSRLTAEAPLGPKAMPSLNTQGQIVRNLDPFTNAYGAPLGNQNPALAAIQQAVPNGAPMPMQRPLALMPTPSGAPVVQTLRKGQSNGNVASLQSALGIKSDGIFGSQTDAAVKAFQKANGLKADGIVGPKTMAALAGQPVASAPKQTTKAQVVKKTNSNSSSSSSSGYGSKGPSEAGKALRSAFAYAM